MQSSGATLQHVHNRGASAISLPPTLMTTASVSRTESRRKRSCSSSLPNARSLRDVASTAVLTQAQRGFRASSNLLTW